MKSVRGVDFSVELDPVRAPVTDPFRRTYIRLPHLDWLHVKLGLEKAPIGVEELTANGQIPFVDRSEVTDRFAAAEEMGLFLESTWNRWMMFQASVTNGGRRLLRDDNRHKDVGARTVWAAHEKLSLRRVPLYNPVIGGFVTEAEHLDATNRFLAPMDQTHTLTGGLTYRHQRTGLWIGTAMEYGSGTPLEHAAGEDHHADGEAEHTHAEVAGGAARVPGHFTANLSFGIDVLRGSNRRPQLSFQIDIENVGNNLYLVAQESEFTPGQYSIPRLVSATAKVRL